MIASKPHAIQPGQRSDAVHAPPISSESPTSQSFGVSSSAGVRPSAAATMQMLSTDTLRARFSIELR